MNSLFILRTFSSKYDFVSLQKLKHHNIAYYSFIQLYLASSFKTSRILIL